MKKTTITFIIFFMFTCACHTQEWLTSLDVAKNLATIQDKLLFVTWEGSLEGGYPVFFKNDQGYGEIVDLVENEFLNSLIWDYFVPVKIPENKYEEQSNEVKKTRGLEYYNRLIDDSIKIMDINGNILNVKNTETYYADINYNYYLIIVDFIKRYALNTSFLKVELKNYSQERNFVTTFRLASQYIDYAVLASKEVRPELIDLSSLYLQEAEGFLIEETSENINAYQQRIALLKIKQELVLNKPKKVLRQLKKMDELGSYATNESLVSFLYFSSYLLLKDENNAKEWRSKLSSVNLKMAYLILQSNSNIGNDN